MRPQLGEGSTLITIAINGLHNESVGLMYRITGGGYAPYVISELALPAPIVAVAVVVLFVSGRKLGLGASSAPSGEAAARTSENPQKRKFNFREFLFHALG